MSEPTLSLHERLREAESAGMVREAHELWQSAPVQDLAAIQKQIEDDATAPLRSEVADLGAKVIALRREADDKHAENVALKARADALRKEAEQAKYILARSFPRSEFESAVHEAGRKLSAAVHAYDAADRAGEAPGYDANEAYAQDPARPARPDSDRITDLVTRADAATSRLDRHMQRLDDFQHWREVVDKDLHEHTARIVTVETQADALEATRTPVPVVTVTDEMVDAFCAAGHFVPTDSFKSGVRAGIAAALAAGGEK